MYKAIYKVALPLWWGESISNTEAFLVLPKLAQNFQAMNEWTLGRRRRWVWWWRSRMARFNRFLTSIGKLARFVSLGRCWLGTVKKDRSNCKSKSPISRKAWKMWLLRMLPHRLKITNPSITQPDVCRLINKAQEFSKSAIRISQCKTA